MICHAEHYIQVRAAQRIFVPKSCSFPNRNLLVWALDFWGTQVTDAGLKDLAGLKRLQSVVLDHTRVSDAGLKHLGRLESLQRLTLIRTQVTDAGLKDLAGLKS